MAMDIYVPVETDVIHKTKADFSKNISQRVIHLVQYDKKLPVIDIELFIDGEPYVIPESAEVYALWGNNDNTYVRIKCMTNNARTHVYFKVEQEMCYLYGQVNPILELVVGDNRAGSSSIPVVVDRNPVQEYYVPAILPEGGIPLNALSKEGATTETYIGFDGTNIVWKEVSGGGGGGGGTVTSIQAGEGLSTAPDSSQSGGTITTSGSLYLVKSGVNEGTYTKVVVDKYGRVTAGYSLSDTDIPNLPASKITTGTLDTARIPNLPASKITSGVFDVARIPALGYYTKPQNGIPLTDISVQGAATDKYLGYDGTNLVWKVVPAGTVTEIIAGDGLTTTQDSSTSGGSITSSGTLYLAITGVSAGTYMKVAVDKYGRVTAGYSITDEDIPNLPASKITSGVLDVARIPTLGYYTKPQTGIPLSDISVQGAATDLYVGFDGTNVVWKTVSALPPYTHSDANKGLHVNATGTGVEWKEDEAGSIIDVTELPTSNIRSDVFYRLNKHGKKIIRNVPCDKEQFSSMIFNHDLSISEVEAIITRPEVFYNDMSVTLGGQTVTVHAYFITYNDDASYADNLTYSFAIIKIPDLYNLMFITNLSLITYIQYSQLVGTPMVLWCNNGDVLSQITSGMFSVTGWDTNIPSIINCWSFKSQITDPVGLLCNNYLTDLVYISKHTQYGEIVNVYEDGDGTTEACKTVKQMVMVYDDRIIYLDEIPSDPNVVVQNMISGIYPYIQFSDSTLGCIMVTKSPLKDNPNVYLGVLPINDHQPLTNQAMIIPIETYLGLSSSITVDIKENRQSDLYQYADGMWKIVDDVFTYDIDLHLVFSIFFKYYIEARMPGSEISVYEVPKYLLAMSNQGGTITGLLLVITVVSAIILGPGANQNMHIDYAADIFDFDRLFTNFINLLEGANTSDAMSLIISVGSVLTSVMLGLFSPGQNDELEADNIQAFGEDDISVHHDALMDMNLFMPQFIYSLNLNGDNEYDNFYDLLEAEAKNKTFRLRTYLSNDILIRFACNLNTGGTADMNTLLIGVLKYFGGQEPSILEYKFRGAGNESKTVEYEVTSTTLLPTVNNITDILSTDISVKTFFKNKISYKNILRFYRLDKLLPDYPSLTGGFTVQSIFEFNFKAHKDYFTFDYADGKLSMEPNFVGNINSAIDAEFTTDYALLTYFYRYKIDYLSGPNTSSVQTNQQKYAEYFNMKYNNVYLVQESIYNPKTQRFLSNPGLLSPTLLEPAINFTYDANKAVVKYGYGEKYDSITEFNHDQVLVCADIFWSTKWVLLSDYIITEAAGESHSERYQEGYLDIGSNSGHPVQEQIIYGLFLKYLLEHPSSEYQTQYGINVYNVKFSNLGVAKTSSKAINHVYSYIIYTDTSTKLMNAINKFITDNNFNSNPCLNNHTTITTANDGPYAGSIVLREYVKTYIYNPICISQDTMITMGDKTYKRAGDIRVGDIIMTANGPDKVMWIDSMCNKTCLQTQVYTFSDGTVLKVAYDHRVYSLNDKKYKKLSKWKLGEKTITDSGNIVSLVKCELINEPIVHCIIYTFKYNSQYANGLLTGNRLANIKNNFIRRTGAKLYYRLVLRKSNEKYGFKDNK